MSEIRIKFEAAVEVIKNLPKNQTFQPSNELMLRFYSLYKQSIIGPCNIPRPGFWDAVGKAKWDAWTSLRNMSNEEAMFLYVEELKKVVETMPHSPDVGRFLNSIGGFFEPIDPEESDDPDLIKSFQRVGRTESSSGDGNCSENSFYEVAPSSFPGEFDTSGAIKRLQEDLMALDRRIYNLESSTSSRGFGPFRIDLHGHVDNGGASNGITNVTMPVSLLLLAMMSPLLLWSLLARLRSLWRSRGR